MSLKDPNPVDRRHPGGVAIVLSNPAVSTTTGWPAGFRRIDDRLKQPGAIDVQAGLQRGFAIRDGSLMTGRQNFSGAETAERVIRALGEQAQRGRQRSLRR